MKSILATLIFSFGISAFAQQASHHEIYQEFEVMKNAEFPGGIQAFRKMVSENIVYPKEAKEQKVQGKSLLSFIIDEEGKITQVRVMKRLGSGCDEAAIAAILATKDIRWSPATNTEGKAVKVRKIIPIDFTLPQSENKK
ncbi:MAG: hypothetical protein OHK0045_25070 [Raineya sp.]